MPSNPLQPLNLQQPRGLFRELGLIVGVRGVSYGLVHFAMPVIGFWIALTAVLSHFLKERRRKWLLAMGCAGVVIGIVVLAEVMILGPQNMP